MVETIQQRLQKCISELNNDPYHDLSPKSRRLLFEAMNQEIQGDWQGPVEMSKANYVRAQIAILVSKKVLPIWDKYIKPKHPHNILDKSEGYIIGAVTFDALSEDKSAFHAFLFNAGTPDELLAFPVGEAAAHAVGVVLFDEIALDEDLSLEERDEPSDPDNYDCASWAANAYSNGFPVMDNFDAQKSLEFWTWYINEAVPTALATIS